MWDQEDIFDGGSRRSRVNLSTNTASSSSSLLSNVKKERLEREKRRRDERAALTIQRIWRSTVNTVQVRREIIEGLEQEEDVGMKARGLVGLYRIGVGADAARVRGLMVDWVDRASTSRIDGGPGFLDVLREDRGYPGGIVLGILLAQIVKMISDTPT
jgi:ubiquitin-protein ligase E3 C